MASFTHTIVVVGLHMYPNWISGPKHEQDDEQKEEEKDKDNKVQTQSSVNNCSSKTSDGFCILPTKKPTTQKNSNSSYNQT